MARPESTTRGRRSEKLAAYLRRLRDASGLTYAAMAQRAWCSDAALKRAAQGGDREPTWETVSEYVYVCGGDKDEARLMYERAREAATTARRNARRSTIVPKPQFVRDEGDLSGALRDAYRRSGRPSVHEMERGAGPGRLPSSTAHAIIKARTVPRDVRTYIAFLEMCEITGRALVPWFAAWVKVRGEETGVRRQAVLSAPTPLPAEQFFIKWAKENTPQAMPPIEVYNTVMVIDGQQRLASLAELLPTAGGEVDVAA